MYQERDSLERVWDERFQPEYGALRTEVLDTLDAFLDCGILAHGAARLECGTCKHSSVVAFSCKKRGVCPSCAAKRAAVFAEHLQANVLPPLPQRHVVFSLPKRLRVYFKYDRKLNSILFRAAWQSLSDIFSAAVPGGIPGAVLVLQTAGESLNFNPHLHGFVSAGAFLPDGSFQPLETLPLDKLCELFSHRVMAVLRERGLLHESAIAQILSQKHTGFSVWFGDEITASDERRRLFLARYIDRGPVANSKLSVDGDTVTYLTENDPTTHEFSPLEFLARLTPHIPRKWEQTTRYYGFYSARTRGARRAAATDSPPLTVLLPPLEKRQASRTWAALMKRIYELEPLLCPRCGSEMKIKAFITDTREVARLLRSLQIEPWTKPEPIRATGPPPQDDCFTA